MSKQVFIGRDQVANGVVTEHNVHQFYAEASELLWAPGFFPPLIQTDLGNGLPMTLEYRRADGSHVYKQQLGCISLTVIND